ncbi:hypothetical protein CVT24_004057 [Panaeolus cyanescens]|uniref:J domain-containing protein n=1 Tax=Panaeolus cyanescens TaxID=181874 RepID=A0A409Y6A6_9AGAR|nr:hypothetical protein CVT24_004057 [Panaeolus cyanescens]
MRNNGLCEDHEIFDLVTALENAEGKGTTFYSYLDVPHTATKQEILKAYRKKSMQLHPDKNPGVKGIHDSYDFFYKNGVPKWRGTGYYYSRFRPGLGSVLTFLVIITSTLQYVVQKMNYRRDLERIEVIISKARAAAWGPKLTPVNGQRKIKINLGDAHDEDGGYVASKWLDMVVDGTNVYLLDEEGEMHPIDSSTAVKPSFANTWFISMFKALLNKVTAKGSDATSEVNDEKTQASAPDVDSDDVSSVAGSETTKSGRSTPSRQADGARVLGPTSKAGGMRRKNVRRK